MLQSYFIPRKTISGDSFFGKLFSNNISEFDKRPLLLDMPRNLRSTSKDHASVPR